MKYSVIIPVYNKEKTISTSIKSVLKQTYTNYEIIVVNDGSTDNVGEILKVFKNIKIINQENQGVSVARNTGIKNAKGEFICFLDADDIWLPNHLETLEKMINIYPNNNFFSTSYEIHEKNGKVTKSSKYLENVSKENIFVINNLFQIINNYSDIVIHTNSICIRKELLDKQNLFFEKGIKIGEDTDLWYRIAISNPLIITKIVTTLYRRKYSNATKYTSNTYDWIFAKRLQSIIDNIEIKDDIKEECIKLIDRYYLHCSRCYMTENKRKEAIKLIKKVRNKNGKNFLLTYIFIWLPVPICKLLYANN